MAAVEASAPQPALLTWKTAMSRAVVTPDSPPNEHLSESYTTETTILEGMHQHLRRLREVKNCCKTNENAILSAKPGQLSRQDTYNRTQFDGRSRRFENQEDAHTVYKLRKSFQKLVRHAILRKREEELLTAEELATVGQTLQSVCSARTPKTLTGYGGCLPYLTSGWCNYTDFSHLHDNIPERARHLFGVQHFLQVGEKMPFDLSLLVFLSYEIIRLASFLSFSARAINMDALIRQSFSVIPTI